MTKSLRRGDMVDAYASKAAAWEDQREAELLAALERADKLINWMAGYIGQMAPGSYSDCYRDLNEHGLFMERRAGGLKQGSDE